MAALAPTSGGPLFEWERGSAGPQTHDGEWREWMITFPLVPKAAPPTPSLLTLGHEDYSLLRVRPWTDVATSHPKGPWEELK